MNKFYGPKGSNTFGSQNYYKGHVVSSIQKLALKKGKKLNTVGVVARED